MSDYFRFIDLPAELRNMVYRKVFDGVVDTPQYPWRGRKQHDIKIVTSDNLLLASKQLRSEGLYIWYLYYDHKPYLYILETVPEAYDVMMAATIDPDVAAADFILCGNTINSQKRDLVEYDVMKFIYKQRGLPVHARRALARNSKDRDEASGLEVLKYPTFVNGMDLNVFKALDENSKEKFGLDVAVVLTGKVRDLYWSRRWDIDFFRRRASLRR